LGDTFFGFLKNREPKRISIIELLNPVCITTCMYLIYRLGLHLAISCSVCFQVSVTINIQHLGRDAKL
jgi:hypothetical protein